MNKKRNSLLSAGLFIGVFLASSTSFAGGIIPFGASILETEQFTILKFRSSFLPA